MDALDPLQLDVAGRRRAADHRQRRSGSSRASALGHAADDLVGGRRRRRGGRAAATAPAGPGRGEPSRTIVPVSAIAAATPVTAAARSASATAGRPSSSTRAVRPPLGGQPGRRRRRRRAGRRRARSRRRWPRRRRRAAEHGRLVVHEPVDQQVEQHGSPARPVVGGAVVARRPRRDRARLVAERRPDPRPGPRRGRSSRRAPRPTAGGTSSPAGWAGRGCASTPTPAAAGRRAARPPAGEEPAEAGGPLGQPPQPRVRHRPRQRPERRGLGRRAGCCASTCSARRCTRIDGMSMRHRAGVVAGAAQADDAYGSDALSSTPVSCGDRTAPIGPG